MKKGSYRSLFPREEDYFIGTRILAVLAIICWIAFSPKPSGYYATAVWLIIGIILVHMAAYRILQVKTTISIPTLYSITFGLDIALITALVYFTGGLYSSFYLLYFIVIGFSAYQLGLLGGLFIAFSVSASYVLVNYDFLSKVWIIDLPIRLGMCWFYAILIGTFSKHFKNSGDKLLHLLDTLNERTTELEQTQIQVETIYETARSLGEIHDLEEVYAEINNIADRILGYQMCSILLLDDSRDNLELTALMVGGKKEVLKTPTKIGMNGVAGMAVKKDRIIRIADLESTDNYIPGLENARCEMATPMLARGKIIGVLNAGSTRIGAYTERDEKLFSVLAASAGMAIENARLHKRISNMTMTDDLTGIHNYRYFVQRLEEEKRRAARYNLPLSLIMMDLDWFKKTNDTYGHEVGNIVLKEIVQVVKSCIRDTDTFCRYGGEEFIIILPQTGTNDASLLGERIRESVEKHDFSIATGIPELKITVSLGTTSFPDNGLSTTELVQTVDMALYRAKGSGKNMVCTV